MKKLLTLFLAAGMTLTAVHGASAVEVNVSGTYDFAFTGASHMNGSHSFMDSSDYRRFSGRDQNERHFDVYQRLRLGLEFVMNEQLSAFYQAQVGTFTWGGPYKGGKKAESDGGALATRAANVSTRQAYLDWMIPQTDIHVRMGQQEIQLPNYVAGSPILDDTAAGIVVSSPITEDFELTAFWLRAMSDPLKNTYGEYEYDSADVDLFGLIADMKFDCFRLTPWGIYGRGGKDITKVDNAGPTTSGILPFNGMNALHRENGDIVSAYDGSDSSIWFAGFAAECTPFDPLRLALDFYYSATSNGHSSTERDGWYLAGLASYKTTWAVPAIVGWYASGDDSSVTNGSEQPLTLSGGFAPGATAYFDGRYSIANTIDRTDAGGTWGISLQLNEVSFLKGLSHDFAVTYFMGTNDKNMPNLINNVCGGDVSPADYLTDKDHIVELDFNTSYHIYKNLITVLELSYLIQDLDKSVWRSESGERRNFSNAWSATLNFRYKF